MSRVPPQSTLPRFYDLLDGFEPGDPIEHLADDLEFDMMFPAAEGLPPERFHGSKADFQRFMAGFETQGPRFQHSDTVRRHNIDSLTVVDGLELMAGRGLGSRRNGTLLAAAQANDCGQLQKYAFAMSVVQFSPPEERVLEPPPNLLSDYFDRVDGVSAEESLDVLADDLQFEMVFPGLDGPIDQRISRGKDDFKAFQAEVRSRRPRRVGVAEQDRRHHLRTSTIVDGLVIVVAEARNGRRNGTLVAAAEADRDGRMCRYIVAMAPAVTFPPKPGVSA